MDKENLVDSEELYFTNNKIAYVLYTSGSTGEPKAVALRRSGLNNFIEAMSERIGFPSDNIIGCFTNATFDILFLESI